MKRKLTLGPPDQSNQEWDIIGLLHEYCTEQNIILHELASAI